MAVFAVHISADPPTGCAEQLEKSYPKSEHYKLSDRVYLVRSDGLARTIAQNAGIAGAGGDGPESPTGAVFKLNAARWGFDNQILWEWLATAENA